VLAVVALALGLVISFSVVGTKSGVVVVLSLVLLAVLAFPMVRRVRGKFDPFAPLVVCVVALAIGYPLRALSIVLEGLTLSLHPLSANETIMHLSLALFYTIIGVVFLYWGYASRLGNEIGQRLPTPGLLLSGVRMRVIVLGFSIIGILFYLLLMRGAGGIVHFITNMAFRAELLSGGGRNFLNWGASLMPLATVIWYVHYLTVKRSKLFWVHLVTSSLMLMSLGGRSAVILLWLVLGVLYHYLVAPIRLRTLIVLGFVFIIVFSSGMLAFRTSTFQGFDAELFATTVGTTFTLPGVMRVLSGDLNSIDRFIMIMRGVPDELPLQFGTTFATFLVMPIPRAVWPSKPVNADGLIVQTFFPGWGGGGIPPSLLGEFYMNFLFPGIIFGMFVFGLICRMMYSYLTSNKNNAGVVLIYAFGLTYVLGFSLSGNFSLLMVHLLMEMIPIIGFLMYASRGRILMRRHLNARQQRGVI